MRKISYRKTEFYSPRNKKEKALVSALVSLRSETDMSAFMRDLMTLPEIEEFSNRLEIARLLLEGHSYEMIAKKAGSAIVPYYATDKDINNHAFTSFLGRLSRNKTSG